MENGILFAVDSGIIAPCVFQILRGEVVMKGWQRMRQRIGQRIEQRMAAD